MDISFNLAYLYHTRDPKRSRSIDKSMRLCREAGFRVLDCSVDCWSDGWKREADSIMDCAAKYGILVEQSHAPYNFYTNAPADVFAKALDNAAEAAIRMGVKYLVFHADQYHPPKGEPYDGAAALESAYSAIAPAVEKLVAGGVKAALETVFEDHCGVSRDERSHFCGDRDMEELIAVIDRFNDPMVGCCWDFGHARLAAGNDRQADAIRKVGSRIICTHTHDNYYGKDLHLPPFMGDLRWEQLMPALRETGYTGSLTFEMVYGSLPDEQIPPFLAQLYRSGEMLCEMFDK